MKKSKRKFNYLENNENRNTVTVQNIWDTAKAVLTAKFI